MSNPLNIEYLQCSHGVDKRIRCPLCEKARRDLNNRISLAVKEQQRRIPIQRGCPNSPNPCFCNGSCKEIIGYRDPMPHENNPSPYQI